MIVKWNPGTAFHPRETENYTFTATEFVTLTASERPHDKALCIDQSNGHLDG